MWTSLENTAEDLEERALVLFAPDFVPTLLLRFVSISCPFVGHIIWSCRCLKLVTKLNASIKINEMVAVRKQRSPKVRNIIWILYIVCFPISITVVKITCITYLFSIKLHKAMQTVNFSWLLYIGWFKHWLLFWGIYFLWLLILST